MRPRWQPSLDDYVDLAGYLLGADRGGVIALPRIGLAESALHAPFASFGGVEGSYPDLIEQAAVLVAQHAGQVLARQRVMQELLEVMARDGDHRSVLMGPEPSERAVQIHRHAAVQPGGVALELGLVQGERHPRRMPPASAGGGEETAPCGR